MAYTIGIMAVQQQQQPRRRLAQQLVAVLHDQVSIANAFYMNPKTRTPILIIWIASFGSALHSSVTTYFYIECAGASDMDIGRIGFLQSAGSVVLAPLVGYALDRDHQQQQQQQLHGSGTTHPQKRNPVVWPLLITTATACSVGCLWRGLATSVTDLYIGAVMLAIGVNLWTVVLLHLSHSTPREQRSRVLSGFVVQEQGLRLLGKGLFPFWDYLVKSFCSWEASPDHFNTTLFRYRIHMGICTVFCFFGTCALLFERKALQQSTPMTSSTPPLSLKEEGAVTPPTVAVGSTSFVTQDSQETPISLHIATPTKSSSSSLEVALASPDVQKPVHKTTATHFRYAAILSALLIQSWSSTVLAVLWPLFLRDQFQFTATEYGLVTVAASICSTSAIASFPKVEHHVGRLRTAAGGAAIASLACCLAFVVLPNLIHYHDASRGGAHSADADEAETNPDAVELNIVEQSAFGGIPQSFLVHAILAIVFDSTVRTLEPSLKSILSLMVPTTAQNRSLGFMYTLGGLGSMGGNIMGTWMFQISNDSSEQATRRGGFPMLLGNGALPFAVVAFCLALASLLLWLLEWEETRRHRQRRIESKNVCEEDGTEGILDQEGGLFYPLMQMETSYEMKLD